MLSSCYCHTVQMNMVYKRCSAEPRVPTIFPEMVTVNNAILPLREPNPCRPIRTQFTTHLSVQDRPIRSYFINQS
jgi:hypothetical protein